MDVVFVSHDSVETSNGQGQSTEALALRKAEAAQDEKAIVQPGQ